MHFWAMLSLQIHPRQRAAGACSRDVTTFLCLISTPNVGSLTVCCMRSVSVLENQSLEPKSLLGTAKVTEEVRQRVFRGRGWIHIFHPHPGVVFPTISPLLRAMLSSASLYANREPVLLPTFCGGRSNTIWAMWNILCQLFTSIQWHSHISFGGEMFCRAAEAFAGAK